MNRPQKTKQPEKAVVSTDYSKPKPIDKVRMVFPANMIGQYLPPQNMIPADFYQNGSQWAELANALFMGGMTEKSKMLPKENIDPQLAVDNIVACLKSFEPKHEHKIAGVGYLFSLWFEWVMIHSDVRGYASAGPVPDEYKKQMV